MQFTIEEAQADLLRIVGRATAGEEVFILNPRGGVTVQLVPVPAGFSRLTRHPDLIGSTKTLDPEALTKPLPPEEWGGLAGGKEYEICP